MMIAFVFLLLILSILFTIEPTHLIKSYSPEKHDQTSINLIDEFDFIG